MKGKMVPENFGVGLEFFLRVGVHLFWLTSVVSGCRLRERRLRVMPGG